MPAELREFKERVLKLLEEDKEFRYAVAGYLGILEVLERMDRMEARMAKMHEEMLSLREEMARTREEQVKLREEQIRLREEQMRMREEFDKRFEAHEREIRALKEEQVRLREDFNRMQMTIEAILKELRSIDKRLTRVERTLEKLTVDIEEEARSIVAYRLRQLGYDIKLERLQLPGLEINLYGAARDLCVIGECSVRATPKLLEELKRKYEALRKLKPDLLRPRVLLVIYASHALPELVEFVRRENVWVLKATADYTPCPLAPS